MKVTIKIEGQNKTFTADFISGRMFRKTIEIQKKLGKSIDVDVLDDLVNYVVELFNKQFTADEFYDGIDARKLIDTVVDCINGIMNDSGEAVGADPNDPN